MRKTRWFLTLGAALAISGSPAAAQTVQYYPPPEAALRNLPFSEAVRVGDMLYLSGQVGVDPATGEVVTGGIEAETRQTMENIRTVLERHGSSFDRVIRCLVMIADISEWPRMNTVYVTFFGENLPARSALGANGLALGARVEIECTAVVGG
jgi:reactive intermediate/imine deaminase